MRRLALFVLFAMLLSASSAWALTVKEVIELSKAGVGDEVLLALIDVDQRVFTMDPATVTLLKSSGVSEPVIVAMIRSGRSQPVQPTAVAPEAAVPQPQPLQPQVVVIDHHDQSAQVREVPVAVPVAVPVYVPFAASHDRRERVSTTFTTEDGSLLRANVPVPRNCTKAEPVYWGNGGKRLPGTWEPPTQVVCR